MSIQLFVPCRVISVFLTSRVDSGLSPMEKLALEAIYGGVKYFEDLVKLFSLGDRPALDLVSDLWRRGYVAMDLQRAEVSLTEPVAARIRTQTLGDLSGGQGAERRQDLFQELLSGHVIRPQRRPWKFEPKNIVPVIATDDLLVRREEVVGALHDIFLGSSDSDKLDLRLVDIRVNPPASERSRSDVMVEVSVDPRSDSQSGRLELPIVGPQTIPHDIRQDMQRALENLAVTLPGHVCFRQLTAVQPRQIAEPTEVVGDVFEELETAATRLPTAADEVDEAHERLTALGQLARRRLNDVIGRATEIAPLVTIDDHIIAIRDILRDATRQVVLCLPILDYKLLTLLKEPLVAALEREVSIFVLWGERPDSKLPEAAAQFFQELSAKGNLVWSTVSCRIRGTTIVQDQSRVLLATTNIVAAGRGALASAGIVLSAGPAGSAWVADVLFAAKRSFGDYLQSKLIEVTTLYGLNQQLESLPVIPSSPGQRGAEQTAALDASIILWQRAWRAYAKFVSGRSHSVGWSAEIVTDIDHQRHLWAILRRPNSQLVLLSRSITADVVTTAFVDTLRRKLEGGCRVFIGYQRPHASDETGPLSSLQGLAAEFPDALRVAQTTGRVELLADDFELLITSFELLRTPAPSDKVRRPKPAMTVGVLLRHPDILSRSRELLADWGVPSDALQVLPKGEIAASPAAEDSDSMTALQGLLDQLVEETPINAIALMLREWFANKTDPKDAWADLDVLESIAAPYLDLAAACCLSVTPVLGSQTRNRWLDRLAHNAWMRGDFIDSLFLSVDSEHRSVSSPLPSRVVMEAAATRGLPALQGPRLTDAALHEGLGIDEKAILVALATESVLVDGSMEAADCLGTIDKTGVEPALVELADGALSYWSAVGQSVPFDQVRALQENSSAIGEREQLHASALEAFGKAETVGFSFGLGLEAWQHLFGPTGPLTALKSALMKKDAKAAGAWLKEFGARPRDVEDLLDRATDAVRVNFTRGEDRIVGSKRAACISRLTNVVRHAQRWSQAAQGDNAAHFEPFVREGLGRLAKVFCEQSKALTLPSQKLSVDAPIIRTMTDRLQPLAGLGI